MNASPKSRQRTPQNGASPKKNQQKSSHSPSSYRISPSFSKQKKETLQSFEQESQEIKRELEEKYAGPYISLIKEQKTEIDQLKEKIRRLEEENFSLSAQTSGMPPKIPRAERSSNNLLGPNSETSSQLSYPISDFRSTAVELSEIPRDDLDSVDVINQSCSEFEITDVSDSEAEFASPEIGKPDMHPICIQHKVPPEAEQLLAAHPDLVNLHNVCEKFHLPSAFENDVLRALSPVPLAASNRKPKINFGLPQNACSLPTIEDEISDLSEDKETIGSVSTEMAKMDEDQDQERALEPIFLKLKALGIAGNSLIRVESLVRSELKKTSKLIEPLPLKEDDAETYGSFQSHSQSLLLEDAEIEAIARELTEIKRQKNSTSISKIIADKIEELTKDEGVEIDKYKIEAKVEKILHQLINNSSEEGMPFEEEEMSAKKFES